MRNGEDLPREPPNGREVERKAPASKERAPKVEIGARPRSLFTLYQVVVIKIWRLPMTSYRVQLGAIRIAVPSAPYLPH